MPAPRKYDQETRDRAVRLYQGRRRDHTSESAIESRRRVGELLDIKPETLWGWVERAEIDAVNPAVGDNRGELRDCPVEKGERVAAPGERDPQDGVSFFRGSGARRQTFVIVAYIDAYKQRFGVEPISRVLSEHGIPIALSTYYAHVAQRVSDADWDDAQLANRLLDLWRANWPVYGIDKLAAAARRAGLDVGRDQVGRLMGIVGISGAVRGRHRTVTTRQDPAAPRQLDRCKRAWTPRAARMSGGSLTSPTCGRWPGSSTSALSPTCSPAGSLAGGCRRRRPARWCSPPSSRRCSPAGAPTSS